MILNTFNVKTKQTAQRLVKTSIYIINKRYFLVDIVLAGTLCFMGGIFFSNKIFSKDTKVSIIEEPPEELDKSKRKIQKLKNELFESTQQNIELNAENTRLKQQLVLLIEEKEDVVQKLVDNFPRPSTHIDTTKSKAQTFAEYFEIYVNIPNEESRKSVIDSFLKKEIIEFESLNVNLNKEIELKKSELITLTEKYENLIQYVNEILKPNHEHLQVAFNEYKTKYKSTVEEELRQQKIKNEDLWTKFVLEQRKLLELDKEFTQLHQTLIEKTLIAIENTKIVPASDWTSQLVIHKANMAVNAISNMTICTKVLMEHTTNIQVRVNEHFKLFEKIFGELQGPDLKFSMLMSECTNTLYNINDTMTTSEIHVNKLQSDFANGLTEYNRVMPKYYDLFVQIQEIIKLFDEMQLQNKEYLLCIEGASNNINTSLTEYFKLTNALIDHRQFEVGVSLKKTTEQTETTFKQSPLYKKILANQADDLFSIPETRIARSSSVDSLQKKTDTKFTAFLRKRPELSIETQLNNYGNNQTKVHQIANTIDLDVND